MKTARSAVGHAPPACGKKRSVLPLLLAQLALSSVNLGASTHFTAQLLEPSTPPLPLDAPTQAPRATALKAELDDLNQRIAATNVNWPTGAVVMAYAGGIALYAVTLTALLLVGRLPTVALLVLASLAAGGLALVVGGLVVGSVAAAAARATRELLGQERDALKRELERLEAPPPSVDRAFPTPAWAFTVATF